MAGFVRLYAAGALVTLGDYLDDVSNSPASLSDDELEAHAREQQQQQQQARPPPPPPPPGAGGGGDGWREETRDDEYVYQDADGYYFDWNTLEWKWAKPGEAPKGGGAAHVAAAGLGPGPELPLPPPPPRPPRRARGRPRGRPLSAPGVSAASLVEPRAAAAARAAARAGAWTNANGFKAGDASTRGAAASPPLDASAAFGAGKLLVAANSFINVFDLSNGGAELKRTVPFSKFFSLIPERTHDVVRSPAVAFDRGFDRGDGRWLLAATSHDSRFVDNGIGGRVLLGASMTSDPKGIWRVIGITLAPLCDVPQYAEPDMLSLSYSKTGIYFSLVLRCHDPTSGAVKSEPRILAVDKVGGRSGGGMAQPGRQRPRPSAAARKALRQPRLTAPPRPQTNSLCRKRSTSPPWATWPLCPTGRPPRTRQHRWGRALAGSCSPAAQAKSMAWRPAPLLASGPTCRSGCGRPLPP